MRLCDMSESEIENKYGPMVRAAGYAGTRSMIAHALAEERSDDSQQRVVGGLNHDKA